MSDTPRPTSEPTAPLEHSESLPPEGGEPGLTFDTAVALYHAFLEQPQQVGRYHVLETIGEGGMGVVYKAEQRHPITRIVALKVLKPGLETKAVLARFEAERQALALMDHSNIAAVFDAGATDVGRPYFVMEYVPGESITAFCDRHRYTIRQRLELFIQACDAIQHAHTKAIIHRDVKPSNLLVMLQDDKPLLKVIDFGVAKATAHRLTERTMFTEAGQLIGTPEYMSPEQAEMGTYDIDTRTDIYSLGVVLYELLAGALPFDAAMMRRATFAKVQQLIRESDPPRPSAQLLKHADAAIETAKRRQTQAATLARELKGELEWIPLKAMRKDRAERYHTALELAQDVRNYLESRPLLAGPESARYRMRKLLRRHRVPMTAAAAVLLALVMGLTLATAGFVQARRERSRAQANALRADREAANARTEAAKATAVSDFLQEMLASANPDRARGAEYTVRQLLDNFSDGLRGQFDAQPEVEAAVRTTIGMAYRRLGLPDRAAPHLERALGLRRSVHGNDHEMVANSLVNYAWNWHEQRRYAEGEARLREALAIYRARGIEGRPMIRALGTLQLNLVEQHRLVESEAVAEEAIAIARRRPDVEFPELAVIYHNLSDAKSQNSDGAEAERLARESIALHLRLHGPDHPETGWGYWALAKALTAQNKPDQAFKAGERGLAIFRKAYPGGHWSVRMALKEIMKAVRKAGDSAALVEVFPSPQRVSELESLLREIMATASARQNDEDDPALEGAYGLARCVGIHYGLGRELAAAGKTGEAEACEQKARALAMELELESDTANPLFMTATYLGLIESMNSCGRPEEARTLGRKVLHRGAANDDRFSGVAWYLATSSDVDRRDPALAVELAARAVQMSPQDGNHWNTLGVARYRAGDFQQAAANLKQSAELSEGGTSYDFFFMAMAYHRLGDTDAARRCYDRGVRWMEEHLPGREELRHFRAEAEEVLGLKKTSASTAPNPSTAPVAS